MDGPSDIGTIDFPPDDGQDTGREVDAVTDVTAAAVAFNSAALPPNLPEWLKDALQAKAAAIVQGMQDDELRLTTLRVRDEEERDIQTGMWLTAAAQERQQWAQTPSTVGGVTKTGTEWAELAEKLRSDEDLHRRIIEAFKARGMTQEEAQARYDRVADVAEIAAIPPSQRTNEQKDIIKQAEADPTFKQDMRDVASAASIDATQKVSSPLNREFTKQAEGLSEEVSSATPIQRPVVAMAGPGF